MVRENTGVRTKIAKMAGSVRVAFVRTELTWRFGQTGFSRPDEVRTENRRAQKFGPKFTGVAQAACRASAEVATLCGELGGVEGV
jgi:hypothetical protein